MVNTKIVTIDLRQNNYLGEVKKFIDGGGIALIKNFIEVDFCNAIVDELVRWRSVPSLVSSDNGANQHMPMELGASNTEQGLDFKGDNIAIQAHNFRLGDLSDPTVRQFLPKVHKFSEGFFDFFKKITGEQARFLLEADGPYRTYLEFVHFPPSIGFVDKHTHDSIADFGLKYNFLCLLTSKGWDYDQGGLVFHYPDGDLDLADDFCRGDVLIFNNRTPHSVKKIVSTNSEHRGRWISTIFYY